jgi:hypothetical protein
MLKAKTKTNKIKFENKTKMEKQNIKQTKLNIPPPSPEFIRQLFLLGFVVTNDNILIKVPTKENIKR